MIYIPNLSNIPVETLHQILKHLPISECLPLFQSCRYIRSNFLISSHQIQILIKNFEKFELVSIGEETNKILHHLEILHPAIERFHFEVVFEHFKEKLMIEIEKPPYLQLNTYNTLTIVKFAQINISGPRSRVIRAASMYGNIDLLQSLFKLIVERGDDAQPAFLYAISHSSLFNRIDLTDMLLSKVSETSINRETVIQIVLKNAATTKNEEMLDLALKWAEVFGVEIEFNSAIKVLGANAGVLGLGDSKNAFLRKLRWVQMVRGTNSIVKSILG
ncbi:hypothetical protein HK098_003252 [Nowakowskiella sp. JEL0407]|nr:hypothetical protein HK098_003252 [Nowakowskiella sp. JEL0407]